jgi:hypothetical protein
MVRRKTLLLCGLFDPLYRSVQDYDLWLKIARCESLGFIPTCEALYRRHSQNMSSNWRVMDLEYTSVLERHRLLGEQRGDPLIGSAIAEGLRGAREYAGCQAVDEARQSLQSKDYCAFGAQLADAFRRAPGYAAHSVARHLRERTARRVSGGYGRSSASVDGVFR